MKEKIKLFSQNKYIKRIIATLCQYCDIDKDRERHISLIKRTLFTINCLLFLEQNYDTITAIQKNMQQVATDQKDTDALNYSIALNTAIDIIANDKEDSDTLIQALDGTSFTLQKKLSNLSMGEESTNADQHLTM